MNFSHGFLKRQGNLFGNSRPHAVLRVSCFVLVTAAVGILLLSSGTAQAGLLAYEGFDYPAGTDALAGSGSASDPGWAGPWNGVTGNANVSAGSLVYPDMVYSGNRATLSSTSASRLNRFPDLSGGGPFDLAGLVDGNGRIGADGTTLYVSFLQRIATVPTGAFPYYTFEFSRDNTNAGRVVLVGHDNAVPSPYYVARTPSNESGSVISAPLGTENADVNLFVLKFTFGVGDDDRVDIYRNPSLSGEPAVPTATLGGSGLGYDFSFDRIALARFVTSAPLYDADEIRFGTTYADVAAVPEPSTVALVLSAGVCVLLVGAGRRMRRPATRGGRGA